MYRSFTIRNFRCFGELELKPLERVNLIVGMNNVGKTALLEALFLHVGPNSPELSLAIHGFRGLERFAVDPEEIWEWLFFDKRVDETIELTSLGEDDRQRSLRIRLMEPRESRIAPPNEAMSSKAMGLLTTAIGPRELLLEYRDGAARTATSRAFIVPPNEVKTERAQLGPLPLGVFLSTHVRFPQEDAARFSNLERVRRQDQVLSALQILDPRLSRLAVLVTGGVPMVCGDVGLETLVPLPLMGEGMVRLLSMVLAIANASGGTVLIDEIENGLHYSVMIEVWKAIAHAARQSDAQIFATTHSWECVEAAHEAFTAAETYDFRLHRLERVGHEIRSVTYDQKTLATAIATGLEVR
ncbi:MAG TPA: AAA family ATPase [Anaerolineae bacterium]|nr:AAA family ATPase [Anaerolineae bacterium]